MKRIFPIVVCLLLLGLAACKDKDEKKGGVKGASVSAPYELLVVTNKEWLKTAGGEPLKTIINAEIPCLPQSESCFRPIIINPANFTRSFRYYANILFAEVSPKYKEAECKISRDVTARPQVAISLTAPDDASFAALCDQWRDQIVDIFNTAELARERRVLAKKFSGIVQRQAKAQFGCDIHAPEAINALKKGKDFFWASSESNEHENYLNLCMYAYPYTSPRTFTLDYFLAKRDSFMRQNIEGEGENQYMSSDRRVMQTRNIEVNGRFVQEVRGLWQMEHAAMGGPFVSYSQVDTVNNRVVVAEGFVFAPGKDKRSYIRELEAALQTLQLP